MANKAKAKDKDKNRDEDTTWEGMPPKLNSSSFFLFHPHLLLLTTSMNRGAMKQRAKQW